MSSLNGEFSSDSDSGDEFNDDMEALRRACQFIAKTPAASGIASDGALSGGESESDGEDDDDLRLVQSIQKRFAVPMESGEKPLTMKPLCTLMPDLSDNDDMEDDYATLRAIQNRFAFYNCGSSMDNTKDSLHRPEQVGATIIDSEKETSNSFVERTNAGERFLNCVDTSEPMEKLDACDHVGESSGVVKSYGRGAEVAGLPLKTSHFPNSALFDAIKKNRSCQKLIRGKMMQMEARMEEIGKLIECVRIVKDFQVACKRRTGRALSRKNDPRVQLISVPKLKTNMKLNENNIPASYKGPPENVHVPNYKEALATFAIPIKKEKWSKEKRENLVKGVKQQFQEMLFQGSVDRLSKPDGSYYSSNVDGIMETIREYDINPERIRSFLPKVNWEQLAAMYVPGHTGAECEARFFNSEDPLINQGPWNAEEDKKIISIIQEKGLSDWIDIAASVGTRTPFQCLARYQRSLNASIMKREWTSEEDNQLRAAVETFGESNWQFVASVMEGRTGTQCSNRWLKTLHPTRVRSGKWTLEEDKRLKVAATLFGPKTWKKVARCVPGRTHVQCRERWVNCLDPSLNKAEWTEEEDLKLAAAIEEHGYSWSKVAACIPHRTDNQCWRRSKVLFPTEVQLLQTARKIQKTALISNFVDRESERSALGPNDFRWPATYCITGSENVDSSARKKKRPRRREAHQPNEKDALSGETCSKEVLRLTDRSTLETQDISCSMTSDAGPSSDAQYMSNGEEIRESHVNNGNIKRKPRLRKKKPGKNAAATYVESIGDKSCSKEYEHPEPIEEPTPAETYLQEIPLDAELGVDNANKMVKVPKLQSRRRNSRKLKEVQEIRPKVPRQAVMKRKMKKDKKLTDAANDHQPSVSNTICLTDITRTEPDCGTKSKKRKNSERNIIVNLSRSGLDPDGAGPVNLHQLTNSYRDTAMQCNGNTDSSTLAQVLEQSGADTTRQSPLLVYSRRKSKSSYQVNSRSCNGAALALDHSEKMVVVEEGLIEDDDDKASEVGVEDDFPIAHFYSKLKKRRTDDPTTPCF